ncbi:MAG: DUF2905 domain-containing protein [FCB group bacterium]|nr:DUF2905 domain-containing protein [FCB group bacterium]
MPQLGKLLILFGVLFVITGLILLFIDKIPFLGKLPGDIFINNGKVKIYIPLVTSIILSVLFTIILNLIHRWK